MEKQKIYSILCDENDYAHKFHAFMIKNNFKSFLENGDFRFENILHEKR